ncbi:hypothetical protein M2401_006768 [Pseudomonas sp. JUb42]|uniref:hypothetical protein n=1 Tax=Pseudomonas sp. JUb42 TaxID=2940611 RepID=UPI002168C9E2|nr:hypothetical protein [Pseudomonas sp. JUb42]MCS3473000.1 hypothetical protein [Pseudomonas sp. JUb42]
MNTFLSAFDAMRWGLVALAAAEYLRRIHPMTQMLLAVDHALRPDGLELDN